MNIVYSTSMLVIILSMSTQHPYTCLHNNYTTVLACCYGLFLGDYTTDQTSQSPAEPIYLCLLVLDCPIGTYGLNCATQCSCLNGASCSPVTGVCNCTAGYYRTDCGTGKT